MYAWFSRNCMDIYPLCVLLPCSNIRVESCQWVVTVQYMMRTREIGVVAKVTKIHDNTKVRNAFDISGYHVFACALHTVCVEIGYFLRNCLWFWSTRYALDNHLMRSTRWVLAASCEKACKESSKVICHEINEQNPWKFWGSEPHDRLFDSFRLQAEKGLPHV
jgi:hypothetical protein